MSTDTEFQKQLAKLSVPEMEKLQTKLQRQISLTEACIEAQKSHLAELQENMKQTAAACSLRTMEAARLTTRQRQILEELRDNTGNQWIVEPHLANPKYRDAVYGPGATLTISNMTYCLCIELIRMNAGGCRVVVDFTVRGPRFVRNKTRSVLSRGRYFSGVLGCHKAVQYLRETQKFCEPYFTEICPPIPENMAEYFVIDNELMPGFRVASDGPLHFPRVYL